MRGRHNITVRAGRFAVEVSAVVVLGLAWGCQSPGATTGDAAAPEQVVAHHEPGVLPALEQIGTASVTVGPDKGEAFDINEIFSEIEANLETMKMSPTLVKSSEHERLWALDLGDMIREAAKPGSGWEMPGIGPEEMVPAWIRYRIEDDGTTTGRSYVEQGSDLVEDPAISQLLSGLPLMTLWYGNR
ncbi:MAG: hypothetical protein K8E66_04130 [Phycisphaerales bacterium]|nr:hypothetical protein [Phycisphaerales bacterium]